MECCQNVLDQVDDLGVSDNVDTIELVLRCFLYFNEDHLCLKQVEDIKETALELLMDNLDSISVGLEGAESEQAELYIDFANIFFPFFLRLT